MKTHRSRSKAPFVVLVTAPDRKTARRLAQGGLEAGLIACANLVPGLESHYVWQGRRERATEVLLLFKTTGDRLSALEAFILAHHPYETPEFVAIALDGGNRRYLEWLRSATRPPER